MRTMLAGAAIAGVGLVLALAAAGAREAGQLLPVDEAATRPDFFSFRAALQAAVARHDAAAVLAVVAPDIRNTFGDDNGVDAFRRIWTLDAAQSRLWTELGAVLALGGSFIAEEMFAAPYVFSRWPDGFDGFEHVVLVAADVRIREAPHAEARVLGARSFAILAVIHGSGPEPPAGWRRVRLDGRVGYVAERLARSPVDYRAIFARRDGRWWLVTFIAGD